MRGHMWQLLVIALFVSACGGTAQPSAATGAPSPSPDVVLSTPSPSAPAAPDSGYLSGVDVGMLTAESEARGLSCSESSGGFSGNEPTKQAWSCDGSAADGSGLMVGAQGPAPNRIEMATAEVLTYETVKVKTITDFLGAMSSLYGGADGVRARAWVLAALPDAQRDGYAETDIGANHYRLTFEAPGKSSATYLLVAPSAPPASPTPGPLPSGSGAAYFGELQGVPGGWTTFVDPGGKFTIAFPGQPTGSGPEATTGPDGSISTAVYQWASKDRETSYVIVATDHAQGVLSGRDPGVVLEAAADEYLRRFNADALDRSATRLGSHFALDAVETNANGFVCLRFLIVGERLYVLGGTETHRCPADMVGFVGSFSLTNE
jgi:hypothetical protein